MNAAYQQARKWGKILANSRKPLENTWLGNSGYPLEPLEQLTIGRVTFAATSARCTTFQITFTFSNFTNERSMVAKAYPDLEAWVEVMEWIRSFWARSFRSCTVLASGLWYDIFLIKFVNFRWDKVMGLLCVSQRMTPLCLQNTDRRVVVVAWKLNLKWGTAAAGVWELKCDSRRCLGPFYAVGAQSWNSSLESSLESVVGKAPTLWLDHWNIKVNIKVALHKP